MSVTDKRTDTETEYGITIVFAASFAVHRAVNYLGILTYLISTNIAHVRNMNVQ